jgi:hypothetical protein
MMENRTLIHGGTQIFTLPLLLVMLSRNEKVLEVFILSRLRHVNIKADAYRI